MNSVHIGGALCTFTIVTWNSNYLFANAWLHLSGQRLQGPREYIKVINAALMSQNEGENEKERRCYVILYSKKISVQHYSRLTTNVMIAELQGLFNQETNSSTR